MTWLYAREMMNTVAAVASARYKPEMRVRAERAERFFRAVAEDDRPSAPSPTQARNAASAMCWRVAGSMDRVGRR